METFKNSLTYQVNKSEEERKNKRKKSLLILVYDFLNKNGYLGAAECLKNEVGFDFDDYEVCDNINLDIMLQDFESYYFLKYQSYVQISKKIDKDLKAKRVGPRKVRHRLTIPGLRRWASHKPILNTLVDAKVEQIGDDCGKMLQPVGPYSSLDVNNEWRILAETVCHEILIEHPGVGWDQVVGHESCKETLKEALVYPMKYPNLFGIVNPWRGMLLYGPTGTGKTMLAKAAATECNATFFYLSPAVLTSKWRGESEKIIKVLFDLAIYHAPSVIFLDEVDSLVSQRLSQEHEASRRFKSELLASIDGFKSGSDPVFILSASNFPWDIDVSMLRRMEKRIYIPLPSRDDRETMLRNFIPSKLTNDEIVIRTKIDYGEITDMTEGYSGADLQLLAKEVKMMCIRKAIRQIEQSSSTHHGQSLSNIMSSSLSIENKDVVDALQKIKPVQVPILKKYEEFTSSSGSI